MVTFGRKQKKEKKLDDLRDPRAHLCTNSVSFSISLEFLTSVNLKISMNRMIVGKKKKKEAANFFSHVKIYLFTPKYIWLEIIAN